MMKHALAGAADKRSCGFTMLELLVVTVILAALAALLLPVLGKARDRAREVQCIGNLKQIYTVTRMYVNDYSGWAPYTSGGGGFVWDDYLKPYLSPSAAMSGPKSIFWCPAANASTWSGTKVTYTASYGGSAGLNANAIAAPATRNWVKDISAFCDWNCDPTPISKRHHNGREWLYWDGHVEWTDN